MKIKHIYTVILIAVSIGAVRAQLLLQVKNDSIVPFSYAGGDEFNDTKLNENEWTNGMGWTRVLMSQSVAFSPKRVKFSNGLLNLETDLEDSTYVLGWWEVDSNMIKKERFVMKDSKFRTKYVSGSIITKKKLHYGLYELRFKAEKGKGVWPAFWFYGGNKNEEIDAFELKGERNNEIHVDTHCPYGCDRGYKNKLGFKTNWGGWMPVSKYLSEGFNIMMLDWRKDEVYWYINGYPLAYFKGSFSNPMNLYINSNVAADGRPFKPGPDETTTWPNKFLVDYIRIWQEQETPGNLTLKANPNLEVAEERASLYSTKPVKKSGLMYNKKRLKSLNGMISLTLSKSDKLTVCILGEIQGAVKSIAVKSKSGNFKVNDFTTENEIQLAPSDTEIELFIEKKGKTLSKKIMLQR